MECSPGLVGFISDMDYLYFILVIAAIVCLGIGFSNYAEEETDKTLAGMVDNMTEHLVRAHEDAQRKARSKDGN